MKISAVIITLNEEENIERCLKSLQSVVDEIVVVDSFSTDRTREICEQFDIRFIQHVFEGHIQQKNYALGLASYDWAFSLDADEELSDNLQKVIIRLKTEGPNADGYIFNRMTNYCGKWIRYSGWYPDRKLRLFKRNIGTNKGYNPHDRIVLTDGSTTQVIKESILHYSYHSIDQHVDQINKFSTIGAEEAFKQQKSANLILHILIYPFWTFIKNYFLKLGVLDGYYGLVVCMNGSYYKFLKYVKLFHMNAKG